MTYFDTARAYTDSEEKRGAAFAGMRDKVVIATKTMARTAHAFWDDPVSYTHLDVYKRQGLYRAHQRQRRDPDAKGAVYHL